MIQVDPKIVSLMACGWRPPPYVATGVIRVSAHITGEGNVDLGITPSITLWNLHRTSAQAIANHIDERASTYAGTFVREDTLREISEAIANEIRRLIRYGLVVADKVEVVL